MVVDNPAARLGGKLNWGFPKELGRLAWTHDGDERELRWLDRDICVRCVPHRFVFELRKQETSAAGTAGLQDAVKGVEPFLGLGNIGIAVHFVLNNSVRRHRNHPEFMHLVGWAESSRPTTCP